MTYENNPFIFINLNGAPETIRTSDHSLRRAVLYPAELRARSVYSNRSALQLRQHCFQVRQTRLAALFDNFRVQLFFVDPFQVVFGQFA